MAKPVFEPRMGEEVFAEKVSGDTWKTPKFMTNRQISGKFYFTDQRVVFLASGLIGTASVSWELEMKDIQSAEPCLSPPCFPFGILLTTRDGGKYKIAILKRDKYVEWLNRWIKA